jgi:hypothetical protein
MNVLIDTNILTRMAQPGHVQQRAALDATDALSLRAMYFALSPKSFTNFGS